VLQPQEDVEAAASTGADVVDLVDDERRTRAEIERPRLALDGDLAYELQVDRRNGLTAAKADLEVRLEAHLLDEGFGLKVQAEIELVGASADAGAYPGALGCCGRGGGSITTGAGSSITTGAGCPIETPTET